MGQAGPQPVQRLRGQSLLGCLPLSEQQAKQAVWVFQKAAEGVT